MTGGFNIYSMAQRIPLSKNGTRHGGKYFAIVDDEDYEELSKHNWTVSIHHRTTYAERYDKKQKVKMHRAILGVVGSNGILIDHKNGNGLDNRRCNIRIVTRSQNNSNINPRGKSKYNGVTFSPNNKWRVRINIDGKRIHIGMFSSEIEAAKAYNEAAIKHNCQYTRLNIIDNG